MLNNKYHHQKLYAINKGLYMSTASSRQRILLLWDYLKAKVCKTQPASILDLKQ